MKCSMTFFRVLSAAALLLVLSACGAEREAAAEPPARIVSTAEPDPYPPVSMPETLVTPAPTPASTPTPTATPTPAPTPIPLIPGKYEGADGSVLKVKADGSCTYEATVSGRVNGEDMSGRLTFHGTVTDGVFSFTRVTWLGLDLTEAARQAGITDASPWETAAGVIYADAIA